MRRVRVERDAPTALASDGRLVVSLRAAANDGRAVVDELSRVAPSTDDGLGALEALAREAVDRLDLRDLELFLAGTTTTVAAGRGVDSALVNSSRVAGAPPQDLEAALRTLLARRPPFLAGLSLALGAAGRPIVASDHGQLVVPTDVVYC